MNKFFGFYLVLLLSFAFYLAHIQYTFYSVCVLGLSFFCYAMLIGANQKKIMSFKPRDKVVCIVDNWLEWDGDKFVTPTLGPKKNEVVVIVLILMKDGECYFELEGWQGDYFASAFFRKFHDDNVDQIIKQVSTKPIYIN